MGKRRKWNIQLIKEKLAEISPTVKVLSSEYENTRTKLECSCNDCSYLWSSSWESLKNGSKCPMCAGNKKLTLHEVKNYVNKNSDCELLSEEYVNIGRKLCFKCECGNVFKRPFNDFKTRKRKECPSCSNRKRGEETRLTKEEAKVYVEYRGFKLNEFFRKDKVNYINVTDEEGYKYTSNYTNFKRVKKGLRFAQGNPFYKENIRLYFNRHIPQYKLVEILEGKRDPYVRVVCGGNHSYETNFNILLKGCRCWECHLERNVGENHFRYNPLITDEERNNSRYELYGVSQRAWSRGVHEKNKFKCVVCGTNKAIEAHHLESWDTAKELRFEITNGITICRKHHSDFHKEYGYGKNTKEQFIRYLGNINKDLQLN